MTDLLTTAERAELLASRYAEVRGTTESLAAPLSPEDQTVQSMPDVSPTKWHRAHTSWFFETFLLEPSLAGYRSFHPAYAYLFNSYYEGVGARYPRPRRGVVSRPGVGEVAQYRGHIDGAMGRLLSEPMSPALGDLVELGLHHEQQHQELLLMDIKHVLSCNPLQPAYATVTVAAPSPEPAPGWVEHSGGLVEVGHRGGGFAFDNECPRHCVHLEPFALADRAVTCGEWKAFVDDGGYSRPDLWLSDGWATAQAEGWEAPLYWFKVVDDWWLFTLGGPQLVDPSEPVCHVSYYEADAFARWSGARLPTESEWETVAASSRGNPDRGRFLDRTVLHPRPQLGPTSGHGTAGGAPSFFGDVWQWTSSAYSPYPGFQPAPGAVGEYNGKFMVNQYVLRGGCCVTPADHIRSTYRNFFPPSARWAFSGLRLARDS
jgi:ergothioneine biosynthesis protein EgtB